jgi:integrase/recombinase XerD
LLGHSSVTVTEKAYLDLNEEDLRVNYAPYSPLKNIMKKKFK